MSAKSREIGRVRFTLCREAVRQAVSMSVARYGYTLTVWTSGAVLTHSRGIPSTVNALLFMLGAVGGFALVGVVSFGRLTARVRVEAPEPSLWRVSTCSRSGPRLEARP
jgi:hypothetical protein